MDFMNRGNRPPQNSGQQYGPSGGSSHSSQPAPKPNKTFLDNYRISWLVLLFSATILFVLVLVYLAIGGKNIKQEASYVESDRYQAVFLNGGQVYFGKIGTINSEYARVSNIYYLRVNQQVQPDQSQQQAAQNDISLVKLGCELHGPKDEMLINADQIVFWENLKTDGQVAQAIDEYVKANPNGQDCNAQQQGGTDNSGSGGAAGTAPAGSDNADESDTPGIDTTP